LGVGLTAVPVVLALPLLAQWGLPDLSRSSGYLSVTLLQGNIPQNEKFETGTGVPLALQWYAEQLQNSHTALVIAPETAVPVLPQQLPSAYWEALQQRFGTGQQAALVGTPLGNFEQGYTNSVVGLKPAQAQPWRYDKHHLVPFGEFIPPFFKWFTAMMNIPLGDFNRGALRQAPFEWQGQRLAATICYEDLFGEELASQFIDAAQAPTIFVNISNLAWFGNTLAIDQHLQIARMRSLEFERAFVLATNTGATAIVDHRARIPYALARNTRGMLVGAVEGRTGVTPYAWWVVRFGLSPLWLLAFGLVALALRANWRNRQANNLALHRAGSPEAP
jgi:apolipoprotein N-acyltransferase